MSPTTRPRLLPGAVACVLVAIGWYLTLAPTRIGGPLTPVIVRGTSMLPTHEPGDLILAYRPGRLEAGQVAVFRGPSAGHVIHRVVAVDGDRVVTQGDNRDRPDTWATTTDDVVGVARLAVPGVGRHLLVLADPLIVATLAGAVAATVVLWPRRSVRGDGSAAAGPAALLVALSLWPASGLAAGVTVTADQLMTQTLTGPFETYVTTPGGGGGGGGGCNGPANRPGC